MQELQSARKKVIDLLGEVKDVEDAVVRAERHHDGKCYAVAYVDLADNVVGRAGELHAFQERILGEDFFGTPGDLRWNKYLYIVAGPKSLGQDGFEKAKAAIEADSEYARKRVVSEEELDALLGAAQHFTPSTAGKDFNVVGEWETRLAAANLDELLDRPTRKDVVERIGTQSAKRVAVADKTLTLNPIDSPLTKKWLASISIDKFRPIHDGKSYTFGQVTLIVGPNGTGKTSLLEAIEYFYCGHNRRQGNPGSPKISGALVGDLKPLLASAESGRIRARCLSWYNRDERFAKSILGAFTRYNFLDTDAAFRLSTELEPSEIPDDLSRLIVGADASTIWDYLNKIAPEIETAYERTMVKVDELRQKHEIAQKELQDLQSRPSSGRALTEAFRAALNALGWKAPRQSTALATEAEANGLQEAIGHLQTVQAAGLGAVSLDAIAERSRIVESALARARPLEADRIRYAQEAKRFADQALESDRATMALDRWLVYLNSGFAAAHASVAKAKEEANIALSRLGVYATGEVPEVPQEYASTPLASALREANLNVQQTIVQISNLEKLSASFGRAASARAQAARQLQAAVQASFDAGHPKDDCPVCRAKYAAEDLVAIVGRITQGLEQSSELTEVTDQLVGAREQLELLQGWVRFFLFLQRIAEAINLASNAVCADIPARLIELRAESAKAASELATANKDWVRVNSSGLSANEHDVLHRTISAILHSPELELDATAIDRRRNELLEATASFRKLEAENLELSNLAARKVADEVKEANSEEWNTRAQQNSGMESLVAMRDEIASIQSRVRALHGLLDISGSTSLADSSLGVLGATRAHLEAIEAVKIEGSASVSISELILRIEQLGKDLKRASARKENYQAAKETLELLLAECSLERATKESLEAIGSEINRIFSRIHAPNEYDYVGHDDVLLQTSASHETRTLEQISTGQRAAFALSVFLALNRNAVFAPPIIMIDDPIAHIDDLNALSFLDYLRDLVVNSNRQIFFATADTRIAALFSRKFSFLGGAFKKIALTREPVEGAVNV
ncbi:MULTISPECIES: AAA family ATPase [unclassified Variovorax]|uniref:AAA family ATPase n=1 Tax=unclassified Variovorax TaxID=663243 RepID=UPI003F45398E